MFTEALWAPLQILSGESGAYIKAGDRLMGRKKLPGQAPDYYGYGDTNEAIMYVSATYHIWRLEGKLLQ